MAATRSTIGGRAYRGETHKYFKVDAGDCRLLVMASVSSATATFLECGGKRSATPLFFCEKAGAGKSAVVTSLCRRSPKCDLLRRKLQLISPHVLTCHPVAACSNASTRFSRHVFRDHEHSPSSASLQGQRAVGRPASWRAQSRRKLWLATRGMGGFFESLPFCSPIAGAGRQREEPQANA